MECNNCQGLGYRREANGEKLACDLCGDELDQLGDVSSAEGGDNSQFETWLSCHEVQDVKGTKLPVYHKEDMREAYFAGRKEALDGVASKLIDVCITNTANASAGPVR